MAKPGKNVLGKKKLCAEGANPITDVEKEAALHSPKAPVIKRPGLYGVYDQAANGLHEEAPEMIKWPSARPSPDFVAPVGGNRPMEYEQQYNSMQPTAVDNSRNLSPIASTPNHRNGNAE